jgi:hypothetical protein
LALLYAGVIHIKPGVVSERNRAQKRIAIIGAGLRGLASAAYLKSVGAQVQVFEKASAIGGVWARVTEDAAANTPSYGYAFHASNQWPSRRPARDEILANFGRMIQQAELEKSICLSTPVEQVRKNAQGNWILNNREPEYDGLLVCPGHLGRPRLPAAEFIANFNGELRGAYDIQKESLRNRNVVVVGSGSSALDMLAMAHDSDCRRATLFIYPGTKIRGLESTGLFIHSVASNPLLYKLTKVPGGKPAAVRAGIHRILKSPRVEVVREDITRITDHLVIGSQGLAVEADTIIWCTGWEQPMPHWVAEHEQDPTMLVAACSSCLDTSGFGYGSATVHAKALMATLDYGLSQRFSSGTSYCDCSQEHAGFSRHIVLGLALYYLAQPARWRLLSEGLRRGAQSNCERMRRLDEPAWASLLAFVNAPFGF